MMYKRRRSRRCRDAPVKRSESMAERECFGILDRVFPLQEGGLREVPPACMGCRERVLCLRAAISSKDGLRMQEGVLERAERAGMMGRLERWSRKKKLSSLESVKGREPQ